MQVMDSSGNAIVFDKGRNDSDILSDAFKSMHTYGSSRNHGIHFSDGDASVEGLIGTKAPSAFKDGWRVFYTQQHGENITWELTLAR